MNIKHLLILAGALQWFPMVAQAQTPAENGQSPAWANFFWSFFPLIILLGIFILLIRRMQKPILKRTKDHMERQTLHMERVEQSLERIARLLEKKD